MVYVSGYDVEVPAEAFPHREDGLAQAIEWIEKSLKEDTLQGAVLPIEDELRRVEVFEYADMDKNAWTSIYSYHAP